MARFTVNTHAVRPLPRLQVQDQVGRPVRGRPEQVRRAEADHRGHALVRGRRLQRATPDPRQDQVRRRSRWRPGSPTTPRSRTGPTRSTTSRATAAMSLATFRKDITIEVFNHQGQKVLAYNVFRCWVSEYQALPQLDAGGQRGDDQHHQAGERGLGARHVRRRAEGDLTEPGDRGTLAGDAAGRLLGRRRARCTASSSSRPLTGRDEELLARGRQRARRAGHRGAQPLRASASATSARCPRRWRGSCSSPTGSTCCCGCARRPSAIGSAPSLICPWAGLRRAGVRRVRDRRPAGRTRRPSPRRCTPMTLSRRRRRRPGDRASPSGCPTAPTRRSCRRCWPSNEAAALTVLLRRCVPRIGPTAPPDEDRVAALRRAGPRRDRAARWSEVAPQGRADDGDDLRRVRAHASSRPFDIQRFFFGELRTDADLLYREVHYLAYHYHWSEREIMAMTARQAADLHRRARRRDRRCSTMAPEGYLAGVLADGAGRSGTAPACASCSAGRRHRRPSRFGGPRTPPAAVYLRRLTRYGLRGAGQSPDRRARRWRRGHPHSRPHCPDASHRRRTRPARQPPDRPTHSARARVVQPRPSAHRAPARSPRRRLRPPTVPTDGAGHRRRRSRAATAAEPRRRPAAAAPRPHRADGTRTAGATATDRPPSQPPAPPRGRTSGTRRPHRGRRVRPRPSPPSPTTGSGHRRAPARPSDRRRTDRTTHRPGRARGCASDPGRARATPRRQRTPTAARRPTHSAADSCTRRATVRPAGTGTPPSQCRTAGDRCTGPGDGEQSNAPRRIAAEAGPRR